HDVTVCVLRGYKKDTEVEKYRTRKARIWVRCKIVSRKYKTLRNLHAIQPTERLLLAIYRRNTVSIAFICSSFTSWSMAPERSRAASNSARLSFTSFTLSSIRLANNSRC
ncbi:hypothetical protein PMAYCL1PPCAC_14018, partial [Pristionchus mayeri]